MTYLDYASMPDVVASQNGRTTWNRASTEHVHGVVFGDSRATLGAFGSMYLERLNYRAFQMHGPPKWSPLFATGGTSPAGGFQNDPAGTLSARWVYSGTNTSAYSGFDKLQTKAASAPGFAAKTFTLGSVFNAVLTPEAVMSCAGTMRSNNAPVINRGVSVTVQLCAYKFTGPVNVSGTDYFGADRQLDFFRGYVTNASNAGAGVEGAINTATPTAVAGFALDQMTTFDFTGADFAPTTYSITVPFKADTTGFPAWGLWQGSSPTAGGATHVLSTWGWRYQDPSATAGLSWTSFSEGGYDFSSIQSLHASCYPTLQTAASVADTVFVLLGYGVNDAITLGYDIDTIYANAQSFIRWVRDIAYPTKRVLFLYEGFTPRLDDGLTVNGASYATRLVAYRKVFHAVVAALQSMGVEFIAVNGGKLLDRRGHTPTNETIGSAPSEWSVATAYVANDIVKVTVGYDNEQFFKCLIAHTGKSPIDENYRGCWVQIKALLGGAHNGYAEKVHPHVYGQAIRADMLVDAIAGPHYSTSTDGTIQTVISNISTSVPAPLRNRNT